MERLKERLREGKIREREEVKGVRQKEMEGVRTGEACSHDLGQGFSQTRVHKDTQRHTHTPPVLLSPRLTSPSKECPSADTAL